MDSDCLYRSQSPISQHPLWLEWNPTTLIHIAIVVTTKKVTQHGRCRQMVRVNEREILMNCRDSIQRFFQSNICAIQKRQCQLAVFTARRCSH